MSENKKVCINCGQENEPNYLYCVNCGSDLTLSEQNYNQNHEYTPPKFNMGGQRNFWSMADYSQIEPTINDVDTKKIQNYVGDNSYNSFMQAFITIKRTGRKMFLNWPVVLLGILLGAPYAAAWFFYRKMYKIGLIISVAIMVLTMCSVAVNFNTYYKVAQKTYEVLEESGPEGVIYQFDGIVKEAEESPEATIANNVIDVVAYVGIISVAVFANCIYLKDITKKIKKHDEQHGSQDPLFYKGLGGTSIASAVFIPAVFSIIGFIISLAPYALAFFK